jgi:integrase
MKLTKPICDRAVYQGDGNTRCVLWDSKVLGLGLRIYPSGRKAWIYSYRAGGRKRLISLGPYDGLTDDVLDVTGARARAQTERAKVIDGKDPLEARKAARAAGMTVRELAAEYLERHARTHKRTWREDESRINRSILPRWGSRPVSSIRRTDVATLHARFKDSPYEGNKVLRLVSKMWNLALKWGYLPETATNPARGVELFHEETRDRWVRPEELPRLVEQITAEPNVYVRSALILYLLTGARKTELLSARWDAVDFSRGELRLPRTKAGRVHYIPLSAPALAILKTLPREEGNPHVFPGHIRGAHLVNVEKNWRAARKAAGLEDVRLHDLRRTVGSFLATAGESLPTIGKILNHSNASTTSIYARLAEDVGRKPLEEHGARVLSLVGEENARALGLTGPEADAEARA